MTAGQAALHILLVDDSPSDVELTVDAFRECGLAETIEVVRTGQAAIDRLERVTREPRLTAPTLPDLVLLDLKMPGIAGIDVLRRVKQDPLIRRIPVVVLTSSRDDRDRAAAYDAGANSYLVKPVSFDAMIETARALIGYWGTVHVGPPRDDRTDDVS